MIFNIQRFSTHDGNGIRTLIFFKGCPLRCEWCSNPESQSFRHEIMFDRGRCIGCLECVNISRNGEFVVREGIVAIQREKIENPLVFKDICPAKAITIVGEEKSVQKIVEEVTKDFLFYKNSEGGVTVSGGEPFAQPDLLQELLRALKTLSIHISVETCLHAAWEHIEKNALDIDVFLADLKHTDPERFREHTGGNLKLILANLKNLERIGANVIIRIPVIPNFNHTAMEMSRILDIAASLVNVHEVHFVPYHALGGNKYLLSGREYTLAASSSDEGDMRKYMEYATRKGLLSNIGG